ncbi:MAG TPA: YggT family protein [Verrucomicrobiae bacterium]|nr:YggT family protein [Verrucomicrobiae bacterium]
MERRDPDIERETVHERVTTEGPVVPADSSEVVSAFNPGRRAVELIYLVFGVIDGLLLIRVALKLLGANSAAGFSRWTYGVTDVLLAPFRNLLPTIGTEQSVLEMSVIVAILVYALIGWALARLMAILFFRNITVSTRSGRLGPRGS